MLNLSSFSYLKRLFPMYGSDALDWTHRFDYVLFFGYVYGDAIWLAVLLLGSTSLFPHS